MAISGRFLPKNPEKYAGNPNNIIFRSTWEVHVFKYLDNHPGVIKWASEELSIPYLKPTDGQVHKYFPDFVVVFRNNSGAIKKEIWEVKPLKESLLEHARTDRDKLAYAINQAKWAAANEFAKRNGMEFRVLTEESLFHKGAKPQRKPARKK